VDGAANMHENRRFEIAVGRLTENQKTRRLAAAGFVGWRWELALCNQVSIWSFMRKLVPSMTTVSA